MIVVERDFGVQEVKRIEVNLGIGNFKAAGGASERIHVEARIRSGEEGDLEIALAGGSLSIRQRSLVALRPAAIDVLLTVPASADLQLAATLGKGDVHLEGNQGPRQVKTGKGDVVASAGSGALQITTGLGDVALRQWQGDVSVETGKGDVAVNYLTGGLDLRAGAGDVALRNWQAPAAGAGNGAGRQHRIKTGSGDVAVQSARAPGLEISTSRGDCSLTQIAIATLNVETSSGDLQINGDPGAGRWHANTIRGDIVVRIPASASARVEAATRRGAIESDLPQVRVGRPGPVSKHGGGRSIGVLGEEPRAEIMLETVQGDIRLHVSGPATTVSVETPAVSTALQTAGAAPATPQPAPNLSALSILESLARAEISVDEAEALLRTLRP